MHKFQFTWFTKRYGHIYIQIFQYSFLEKEMGHRFTISCKFLFLSDWGSAWFNSNFLSLRSAKFCLVSLYYLSLPRKLVYLQMSFLHPLLRLFSIATKLTPFIACINIIPFQLYNFWFFLCIPRLKNHLMQDPLLVGPKIFAE